MSMDYDTWKTMTPEDDEQLAFLCDHCEEPIVVGEEFIRTNDGSVHDSCFDEFAWNLLDASREEAEVEVYYGEDD